MSTYRYLGNDLPFRRIADNNYYITCGYDMIDTDNQRTIYGIGYPIDRVSGYSINQLENALRGSDDWGEWKDRIKGLYNNPSKNNLDELFNNWSDD